MAKTRNFKMGSNTGKNSSMKLKTLVNEIRVANDKQISKLRSHTVIREDALNGILNSGFLTEEQSNALKLYFRTNNIKSINESTARKIDRYVLQLNEGPFDWAKKVYDAGKDALAAGADKFVNAFKSGWSAVKGVWSNFKEIIAQLIDKLKEMFKKVYDFVYAKVKQVASIVGSKVNQKWIETFHEKHEHKHEDVISEFGQLKTTIDHLKGDSDAMLTGEMYADKIENASVAPSEDVPPLKDEEEVKQDIEDLAKEGVEFFSNKQNLIELHAIRLTEGGHLEDNIKHPVAKFIVHWGLKILKAIFSPFSTLVAEVGKLILGKGLLKGTSYFCKNFRGGPGIFKFAILTTLIGEMLELIEDGMNSVFHFAPIMSLAKALAAPLGPLAVPLIDCGETALHIAHYAIAGMALATIIYNLMPLFKKAAQAIKGQGGEEGGEEGGEGGGEEPEVQTAGYKPNGTFKLREGKLIFVQ